VIPAEPRPGRRVYVCAFHDADGTRSWLAVRGDGDAVVSRAELREAVSIAALCELAAEAALGGDVDALLAHLADLRRAEGPDGIERVEVAARALRDVLGDPPQLATPERLDAIGQATLRLEQELDPLRPSPFTQALRGADAVVAELQREIEAGYRVELE
jgi:DNA-binding FadR family transcriptional regulator